MSPKRTARQEQFKKIGHAISQLRPGWAYDGRDHHTGEMSSFEFKRYDAHQREEVHESQGIEYCPWPKDRCEVPLGPRFNTPQWERTVKHG